MGHTAPSRPHSTDTPQSTEVAPQGLSPHSPIYQKQTPSPYCISVSPTGGWARPAQGEEGPPGSDIW